MIFGTMIKKAVILYLFSCTLLSISCQREVKSDQKFSQSEEDVWVKMLVEIPAGTVEKYELNKKNNQLVMDSINGKPRLIDYLGYPANYGMIPKTLLPEEKGGDGDPLDVITIGPQAQRGALIDCKIIGVLKLTDNGEQDDKLIALGKNSTLSSINTIEELKRNYPGILEIIETWFTNYKGKGKMKSNGFHEKNAALDIYKMAQEEYLKLN